MNKKGVQKEGSEILPESDGATLELYKKIHKQRYKVLNSHS